MHHENLTHKVNAIKNTAEIISQSLKEKIYEAELKPGQPLVQENIARMFGVSRVPVRDALQILVNMGIAVNVPRRGIFVRTLSRKLLEELFDVRKILEGSAIKIVSQGITPTLLKMLKNIVRKQKEALKKRDVKWNEKLDDQFHINLYQITGNETLNHLILANWERIKQARCASTVLPDEGKKWIETSIQRHKNLLDALNKAEAGTAQRVIVENIESSKQEIIASLEKLGWLNSDNSAST
jgi:DNA-binding GntR family transcriptional regulator